MFTPISDCRHDACCSCVKWPLVVVQLCEMAACCCRRWCSGCSRRRDRAMTSPSGVRRPSPTWRLPWTVSHRSQLCLFTVTTHTQLHYTIFCHLHSNVWASIGGFKYTQINHVWHLHSRVTIDQFFSHQICLNTWNKVKGLSISWMLACDASVRCPRTAMYSTLNWERDVASAYGAMGHWVNPSQLFLIPASASRLI